MDSDYGKGFDIDIDGFGKNWIFYVLMLVLKNRVFVRYRFKGDGIVSVFVEYYCI